jgi:hypothetical protein
MKKTYFFLGTALVIFALFFLTEGEGSSDTAPTFNVTLSKNVASKIQEGRLVLLLSTDSTSQPRFQISYINPNTQLAFGTNVKAWKPGHSRKIDSNAYGWPVNKLKKIPNGQYYVQAVLNRYSTYHLSDGRVLHLPTVKLVGYGQSWNRKPGNLYSKSKKIQITSTNKTFSIKLDNIIPPRKPFKDTKYIKHIKFKSKKLSKFWGRDIYLGAFILLPKGFKKHLNVHYPFLVNIGHYPRGFNFRKKPPTPINSSNDSLTKMEKFRFKRQQEAYKFYKIWTSKNLPRYLIIKIQHPTPYFDDSYAVNSANTGPYGDAINKELIPYIEKKFRGLDKGWAHYITGGSTGGWESLADQIFYPDEYGGVFAACPDGVDFRNVQIVNIYKDDNAYYVKGKYRKIPRPDVRDSLGHILTYMADENHLELALGTNSRGGGQWDVWNATFSPVGQDGYPADIWDKKSGKINHKVAEYWKKHYDLRYILKQNWNKGLGKKLRGKIHIYVGNMDTYYLNLAVYHMAHFLKNTTNPYYGGKIVYGIRRPHCYTGPRMGLGHTNNMNLKYIPQIMELIKKEAPPEANLTSWRY